MKKWACPIRALTSGKRARLCVPFALALSALVILWSSILTSCKRNLPIQATIIEPQPAVVGYFGFPVPSEKSVLSGTVTVWTSLRTIDGHILATRTYSMPLRYENTMTDTVATNGYYLLGWSAPIRERAQVWGNAEWRIDAGYGEYVLSGWWHDSDFVSHEPGDDGTFLIREIEVHTLFFPIMFK